MEARDRKAIVREAQHHCRPIALDKGGFGRHILRPREEDVVDAGLMSPLTRLDEALGSARHLGALHAQEAVELVVAAAEEPLTSL
eukprot:scaffold250563_cov31-Tisochrysis_lutea.AAC.3